MKKTYTATVYPRFNGMYYTVRFPDFDNIRGENLEPEDKNNVNLITKDLQEIVDGMVENGKSIPDPKFVEYDNFESSYGNEIYYIGETVTVPVHK